MKLAFQLAYKNLIGAGLRTWLNVGVLALSFIIIIFFRGFLEGWNHQAIRDNIEWELGAGHLVHNGYDPYDPFSILDGHGRLTQEQQVDLFPVLVRQASLYPEGRMLSVALKGIDGQQNLLELPTASFTSSNTKIPAIIGKNMATSIDIKEGDEILLRWRDKGGTFDAANVTIVKIFSTNVITVDKGQVWIPIQKLWEMTGLENHASYYVANENYTPSSLEGWNYKTKDDLLSDFYKLMEMEKISTSFMYLLLLAIALLAIFDTQVLSVFRRQKEIGTYIALGMTRSQVVGLFTVEGTMYSLFAMIVGCIFGLPLFWYLHTSGISFPDFYQDMGVSFPTRLFPSFGIQLILTTILLVVVSAAVVSYLPARKIAKMNPVLALKGKMQ
ncbi:MAG: FtsX-like permease family protein [Saprospiraceae bacterium]|nr:FtsX-like permease family protein [Saprospiraceae bacterium]